MKKFSRFGSVMALGLSSLSIVIGMVKFAWGNDAYWFIGVGIVCFCISWLVSLALEAE